ncbi:MAG: acyl-ACP--UDP-N-acetylglucosamine O-acyltransferase [Bacteroidetes bacterium]|nr:acyl-ACP--UDP-N-acetylglucosamine O-acyltransferase [Bacteroidota bacterium]
MANIHPTAIVSPSAILGDNVHIGAYSIVEDNVTIGNNTKIGYHCVIGKRTTIGKNNKIYNSAILGTDPQDMKYNGELTTTIIGDNNIIREFVTINNGTNENKYTIVGNNNVLLSYVHIAHDNRIGNNIIMSNIVQLGGHVVVEDNAVIGGCAAVHQFCTVGKFAMIGAGAIITQDAPPFSLIDRVPKFSSINRTGLARNGFSEELRREISNFYQLVFKSGYNNTAGIKAYLESNNGNIAPEIQYIIDFINKSQRGVIR